MFLQADHPELDTASKYIHIFGWPALLGFIWLLRGKMDEFLKTVTESNQSSKSTERMSMEIHAGLKTIETNHLAHIEGSINRLADMQEKQTAVLASLDKGIAVLGARQTAPTFVKQG